jgi:dipeptidyl aminopeptidase/acylaminoacyl peptidase
MTLRIVVLFLVLTVSAAAQTAPQAGKRPFTFEDMMALKRVSDPVPSPNGKWIVFSAVEVNVEENTRKSRLWIVPAAGGEARRLSTTENEEERPRFLAGWQPPHLQLEGDRSSADLDLSTSTPTPARSRVSRSS